MKLRCEVVWVESHGDTLVVSFQGSPPSAADWRPLGRQSIEIPATAAHQKAFYVGRVVELRVYPK